VPRAAPISFHDLGLVDTQAALALADQSDRSSSSKSAGLSASQAISILSEPDSRPGHAVYCRSIASMPDTENGEAEAGPGLLVKCAPRPLSAFTKNTGAEGYVVIREVQQPSKKKRQVDGEWWNGFRDRADERGRLLFA
jgi:hypothetical protein